MKYLVLAALAATTAAAAAIAQPVPPQTVAPGYGQGPRAAQVQTRTEAVAKVRSLFAQLDTNRDGFLTRDEARAARNVMRQHAGERRADGQGRRGPMSAAVRAAAFDRLDTNRDGVLSRQEFAAGAEIRQQRRLANQGARGMRGMRFGGRMFDMADTNRDTRVSLQEATDAALRRFDAADLNRDGRLTREERMQNRQRVRSQRQAG